MRPYEQIKPMLANIAATYHLKSFVPAIDKIENVEQCQIVKNQIFIQCLKAKDYIFDKIGLLIEPKMFKNIFITPIAKGEMALIIGGIKVAPHHAEFQIFTKLWFKQHCPFNWPHQPQSLLNHNSFIGQLMNNKEFILEFNDSKAKANFEEEKHSSASYSPTDCPFLGQPCFQMAQDYHYS
jgi:hypothetical protein